MNKEESENYRRTRYEKEVGWYDDRANWNHAAYQICQWAAIVLASLTPILIVLDEVWSKWLAVAVATLVGIAIGALRAFKYHEN